ncbi:MAG: dTMP kinase [Acidobacteriota bacterium]
MLIAFEGLDQSGKETQARQLRARIQQDSRVVRALSFPDYETSIGTEIRQALAGEREYGADVMQLLYVANRFEYRRRIESWLQAGDVIVCDRYRASSIAYGEAQDLDPEWLDLIQRHLPRASITVLLDIAPETAVARKQTGRDRYERDLTMLARVRESYRRQAAQPDWILIDAEQSKDAVAAAVAKAVLPRLAPPSTP